MEQLLLFVKHRMIVNFALAKSENLVFNLIAGVIICSLVSFFLWKGSKGEYAFYSFRKIEIFYLLFWILAGVVFVLPLFPLKQSGVLGILSVFVCIFVLIVTSVTDEKSGMFQLGHLIFGLAVEFLLPLIKLLSIGTVYAYADFVLMGACIGLTLILGCFCYSIGDAGLIVMALLTFITVLDGPLFLFAYLVMLMVAMGTYAIRYIRYFKEMMKNTTKRYPFTLHILIGVVAALFLFY